LKCSKRLEYKITAIILVLSHLSKITENGNDAMQGSRQKFDHFITDATEPLIFIKP